jgi:DNA segregation ATPase FtsK/SpoIIIE, S-DNA-T family
MNNQDSPPTQLTLTRRLSQVIKRFGEDLLGIVLLAAGLIIILGVFDITSGKLVDSGVDILKKGFGWGIYLFLSFMIYIGLIIILRHFERFPKINYGKIFLMELELFFFCALLAAIGGYSVDRANNGLDGGIIGWGFSKIFTNIIGDTPSYILLYMINITAVLSIFELSKNIRTSLDQYFTEMLSGRKNQQVLDHAGGSGISAQERSDQFGETSSNPKIQANTSTGKLPALDILLDSSSTINDEPYIHAKAIQIEKTLEEFGVPARVAGYRIGPTVIQYAIEPGFIEKVDETGSIVKKKVRVSQIVGLKKDITLALSVDRLRIEAPIPGHAFVGIEIPNTNSVLVRLKQILTSESFRKLQSKLSLALGLDVSGTPVTADLVKMPHLLVAGTTGSGKSVCITSLIACLAMKNSPDELKLAILDPKMVELIRFNGLPHLMGRVETQMDRMLAVLAWAIKEMEERYKKLEQVNARDLDVYNLKMLRRGEKSLPKVVIVIDELADLMLNETEKTESYLVRLAQMARAVGIHLIVATQRPSTDIVTGLIKANFPARISFMMASSVDSRVILDANGAESLMGKGDMLFLDPESAGLRRAQCVIVDDKEIENIINYWQSQETGEESILDQLAPWEGMVDAQSSDEDDLFMDAVKLVREDGYASTSRLQRKLRIGFPRAARLMDELEESGIVGPQETGGRVRDVLFDEDRDEFESDLE